MCIGDMVPGLSIHSSVSPRKEGTEGNEGNEGTEGNEGNEGNEGKLSFRNFQDKLISTVLVPIQLDASLHMEGRSYRKPTRGTFI
jgi:hypothetical protein